MQTTLGHAVGAGRPTFESYPYNHRPLRGRKNYILTRNKLYVPEPTNDDTFTCHDIAETLNLARAHGVKKFFCGGGAEFYKQLWDLGLVDEIYYTKVHANVEGDTYFPPSIQLSHFPKQEILLKKEVDEKNAIAFTTTHYCRR